MKRVFLAIIIPLVLLTSCVFKKDAVILLGPEPIEPGNLQFIDKKPVFKQRQRIYYILISQKPIENPKLRLQVLKIDRKAPYFKLEPAYCIDLPRGAQEHYVADYFALHGAGTYIIRIFSFDDFENPIAWSEFVVEDK